MPRPASLPPTRGGRALRVRRRPGAAAPLDRRHRLILALLTTSGISLALMQTLVIPALPFFRHEFGGSAAWTTWIVTGFLLSSSVLAPILGRLGDAHGKKRLLVVSLAIFGVASLGAALAPSLEWLVACRIAQGAGAAIFPLSFGIIRDEFPPEKVGVAIGMVSSVFGIGGSVGLVASGVILEHLNWHWLFLLGGIPVLVSAVLVARHVPESPIRTPARPDYLGGATLSLALVALLVAISDGGAWGWTSARVLGLIAVAAALFAAWIEVERRVAEPLVDLRTLRRRAMAATNAATALVGFAATAFFVLLPAFVQVPESSGFGFGASTIGAGLFFLSCSLAMVVAGPFGGSLGARRGPATPLALGTAMTGAGLLLIALEHEAAWVVQLWLPLVGAGLAFSLAAIGALVIAHSRPEESAVAGAMNSIARTVGGAIGAQVAISVVSANTAAGTGLPLERGFTLAFGVTGAAALVALAITALLRRERRTAPALRPALAS